jgi:hypothetical protein
MGHNFPGAAEGSRCNRSRSIGFMPPDHMDSLAPPSCLIPPRPTAAEPTPWSNGPTGFAVGRVMWAGLPVGKSSGKPRRVTPVEVLHL